MDGDHLNDLRQWIDGRTDLKDPHSDRLETLLRVWYLNPWLPEEMQWPEPPWRHEQWRPKRKQQENQTKRIDPLTMGPLLEWSIAFVTEFAPDIFEAVDAYVSMMKSVPGDRGQSDACRDVLDSYIRDGKPLPGVELPGRRTISWLTMSLRHQLPAARLARVFHTQYGDSGLVIDYIPKPSDSVIPIRGQFQSRPWIPALTGHDLAGTNRSRDGQLPPMVRALRTACLVVIAYLTGARPEEVVALRRGAASEPILSTGGSKLFTIRGHVWKGVLRSEDGSPAKPREAVWASLSVAHQAVLILEKIGDMTGASGDYLFGASQRPIHVTTATGWLREYIDFINERLVPYTANPDSLTIPPDPDGNITLRRFRRTLAWFIRNRPGGEVVLAIQYQHLGELIGSGYAGTKQSGMNDLLAEEDWQRRRSTIVHLAELIESGKGISGPAAQRVVDAIRPLPRLLTPADERRMRKDPDLEIYDNESSVTLCAYDPPSALCHRRSPDSKNRALRGDRPNLLACVVGCKCRARTDSQLDELAQQARSLRAQADVSPMPMAQSLIAEAEVREIQVADFTASRIIPEPAEDEEQ
ncbi:hypothetical protein ASF62_10895 [Leifsonia sp. Leaf325]|nr:hypothetical protein ASF62_10895 [Leifsonia sp. Leaf325]